MFPSIVGQPKTPGSMVGVDQKDTYIGEYAQNKRGSLVMTVGGARQQGLGSVTITTSSGWLAEWCLRSLWPNNLNKLLIFDWCDAQPREKLL